MTHSTRSQERRGTLRRAVGRLSRRVYEATVSKQRLHLRLWSSYCEFGSSRLQIDLLTGWRSALFTVQIILSLVSLYPTKSWRQARRSKLTDQEARYQPWEMLEAPKTPGTAGGLRSPTTPRTKAFNILSSKGTQPKRTQPKRMQPTSPQPERQGNVGIPLKHHVAMDDNETYQGPIVK